MDYPGVTDDPAWDDAETTPDDYSEDEGSDDDSGDDQPDDSAAVEPPPSAPSEGLGCSVTDLWPYAGNCAMEKIRRIVDEVFPSE